MTIADEIRTATARNELHPLVRDSLASPLGTCNAHTTTDSYLVFCILDYGHLGDEHISGTHRWQQEWPLKTLSA